MAIASRQANWHAPISSCSTRVTDGDTLASVDKNHQTSLEEKIEQEKQ
jgi:hypothetical protein